MPYVEGAGARLCFEECGYGSPVIFIHEFALQRRCGVIPLRLECGVSLISPGRRRIGCAAAAHDDLNRQMDHLDDVITEASISRHSFDEARQASR